MDAGARPPGAASAPAGRNRPVAIPVELAEMLQTATRPHRTSGPSGLDDLAVRQRWLRRRHARDLAGRRSGWIAVWVAGGALVSWLFVAGFAGLAH